MKKLCFLGVIFLFVSACGQDKLVGTWVLWNSHNQKGFILQKDGSAKPLNDPYACYTSWSHTKGFLTLYSQCPNGENSVEISEKFAIQKLDENVLELRLKNVVFIYTRQQNNQGRY